MTLRSSPFVANLYLWDRNQSEGRPRGERATMFPRVQTQLFKVRVFYVEPTYALARNIPVTEYKGTFYVRAANEWAAKELAVAEFNEKSKQSGVSWAREIVRCEMCRIDSKVGVN